MKLNNHSSKQKTQYLVDGYAPQKGEYLGTGGIRRIDDKTFVSQYTNPRPFPWYQPQIVIQKPINPYWELFKYDAGMALLNKGLEYTPEIIDWFTKHITHMEKPQVQSYDEYPPIRRVI